MTTNKSFEETHVGEQLPPVIKKITLVGNVMYAAATWDFYRFHYDKEFTEKLGFHKPFVDGQMLGAFMAELVTQWAGVDAVPKKLGIGYRSMAFTGDILSCKGKVTEKYCEADENLVKCELWIENQTGGTVARGHALLALPSKSVKAIRTC